jgi:hypothetical protein
MDTRRLSTDDVLAAGIIGSPPPKTNIPKDREGCGVEWNFNPDKVREELAGGKVLECSEYYGIPYLWKDGDKYFGCLLLRYCAVTESPVFNTADAAIEWFKDICAKVAG